MPRRLDVPVPSGSLPKTTPSNIMLAQILQIRSLANELIDLHLYSKFFFLLEIPTSKLFLDTGKDLNSARILHFFRFLLVHSVGGKGRGAIAWTISIGASRLRDSVLSE